MRGNYKPHLQDEPHNPCNNGWKTVEESGGNGKTLFMNSTGGSRPRAARYAGPKQQVCPPTVSANNKAPPPTGQVRHYMALLGLSMAVVNLYAQNTFFIAIVEMVLPAADQIPGRQLAPTQRSGPTGNGSTPNGQPLVLATDDNSCPIEYRYRHYYDSWRFNEASASSAPEAAAVELQQQADRYNWDAGMQGLLLGACAVGTAPLQLLSGRLAEIYGPRWVLVSAGLGTALTNLAVPALAGYSFRLLLANRILMGVAQAGLEPAIVCLMASWLTPGERGFFLSLLLFAICLGSFVGMLVTTMILSAGLHWSTTFYVAGYLNLVVSVLWLWLSSNKPSESKLLSTAELAHIQASQQEHQQVTTTSGTTKQLEHVDDVSRAPWGRILRCRAVWAFIVAKVSTRWCADVVASELPTYLANVLHLSIKLNGVVNSASAGLFAVFSLLAGYLANELSQRRSRAHLSQTNLRKLFQALGSFVPALNLLLLVRYDCDLLLSIVMLLMLSSTLVLGAGGELQIPYDMTSRFPGTLHGLACTLAVSGWLAPPTIGLILGEEPASRHRWSIVWHLTAAINFIGGLVFVVFADASSRHFDLDSGEAGPAPPPQVHGAGAGGQHQHTCLESSVGGAEERRHKKEERSRGNKRLKEEAEGGAPEARSQVSLVRQSRLWLLATRLAGRRAKFRLPAPPPSTAPPEAAAPHQRQ